MVTTLGGSLVVFNTPARVEHLLRTWRMDAQATLCGKSRPKTCGKRKTHKKVRMTRYERGKKRTYWTLIPLFPTKTTTSKDSDASMDSKITEPGMEPLQPDEWQDLTDEQVRNCATNDGFQLHKGKAKPNRTYASRKKRETTGWKRLLPELKEVFLSTHAPQTYTCSLCQEFDEHIIFCSDCGPTAYYCYSCCQKIHKIACLHVPTIWKGMTYGPFILPKRLSRPNHLCNSVKPDDMVLIDVHGRQHEVKVEFCGCTSRCSTLLSLGFWPATPKKPSIAIDLRLMELCRLMLLEGSMAIQKFTTTMGLFSSHLPNCGKHVDLYRSMVMDCTAYHRRFAYDINHLQGIVEGYPDGSACPTCNKTSDLLPKVVSMDGNFRLVRKMSSGKSDLEAHHDDRFFLPKEVVEPFLNAEPVAHDEACNAFKAGDASRSTFKSKNLDVTGVFGSICVHDYPQLFCDMQSGEKLGYAVCVIQMLMQMHQTQSLKAMYDVACRILPQLKKANTDLSRLDLAVPVFHGFAHIMKCQTLYNPKNNTGFRLADGENTERLWSYVGGFVYITREMTPANRRDLLVDALLHWADKTLSYGALKIVRRLDNAKILEQKTRVELEELSIELKDVGLELTDQVIEDWEKEVRAFYAERKKTVAPGWDEEYATELNKWFSLRWRALDVAIESEEIEAQSELKSISENLAKTEKTRKISRWKPDSKKFKDALQKACDRKSLEVLQKLQFESADRRQFVMMKSRARGHDRAAKLSTQIKSTSGKISRLVRQYNNLPGTEKIKLEDAKDPSSAIFANVTPGNAILPFPICREVILKHNTVKRCVEEKNCIKIEIPALLSWYKDAHTLIEDSIVLNSPPANQVQEGLISMLLRELVQNEKQQFLLSKAMQLELGLELSPGQSPDTMYIDSAVCTTLWLKEVLDQRDQEAEENEIYRYTVSADSDDEFPSDGE